MTEAVVDALEMVDVENHHRHRPPCGGLAIDQKVAGFRETAAVQHAAQGIDRSRGLVHRHGAVRHQHEDHEHGADRVQHQLDRERRHPNAAGEGFVMRAQQAAEQDRQRQHATMHHGHGNRRPALLHRPPPLAPQFGSRQPRIDRDDRRTDDQPRGRIQWHSQRRADPDNRAKQQPRQIGLAAEEYARGVPDHAAGHEAKRMQRQQQRLAECGAADGPDRHRRSAKQIGRPPPLQGRDVFLLAEQQQHGPEHACNHRGKQI
jgi:hypothetical protein